MSGLDNFEFIRQIGKGSYGEVTLQRHKRDRKQYVLKRINLKKASKREQHSAEQEAKLLSKLKHPNIVTYKDSFQKDGYLHIAMQFCEGGDLYTKLKEQKGVALEERQVVEWFVQIAMALQYMHERNILHRDLKTQNIFLTKSKIIKVGDLGIARVLESSSDMATTLIGTPYYMSPELFSNKPYNHKSDVWALGCCVYEMATLKHAFNAKDMNSLVYKILKGKMPPMPRSYTSDLLLLIKGMLHQEPDKRPTVNRILRDPYIKKNISLFLEETKKSRPSSANRPGSASRLRPSVTPQLKKPISSSSNNDGSSAANAKPPPSRVSAQAVDEMDDASDNRNNNMQAPTPSPAILRGHARKPSDGAKVELAPIAEDKPTENKNNNQTNLGSSSSSESTDTVKTKTVKEKSSSEKSVSDSPPRKKDVPKKKRNVLKKGKDSDTDSIASVDSVSSSGPSSSRSKKDNIFKHPKPVDNPRPLPALPKANESEGLPQRRASAGDLSNQNKENGKSSSTSSSKDENASWDMETPREPNLSARERRRAKNPGALSYENPTSARINLKPNRHESQRVTKAEKSEYPVKSKSSSKRIRQPSLADSSSSDEDTLKGCEDIQVDKEKQRENKEMKNFITLLDTTLHLNKEDEKSEEEEKTTEPSIQEMDIHRSVSLPSVETLCNADRLTSRIQILHADCVRGVGFEILHKAFHILANIEDDELEPQLVELMGKEKFDLYAGKIWQLKFCNECFEHLPNISS